MQLFRCLKCKWTGHNPRISGMLGDLSYTCPECGKWVIFWDELAQAITDDQERASHDAQSEELGLLHDRDMGDS